MLGDIPKAVRRTLIVSAGFPGGAGRFRLCRKHSLQNQATSGRLILQNLVKTPGFHDPRMRG